MAQVRGGGWGPPELASGQALPSPPCCLLRKPLEGARDEAGQPQGRAGSACVRRVSRPSSSILTLFTTYLSVSPPSAGCDPVPREVQSSAKSLG